MSKNGLNLEISSRFFFENLISQMYRLMEIVKML